MSEQSKDIVVELREMAHAPIPDVPYGLVRVLLLDAADEIECYRGMKEGFETRINDAQDVIDNLSTLVRRLVYIVGRPDVKTNVVDEAFAYMYRKGLIKNTGVLREEEDDGV